MTGSPTKLSDDGDELADELQTLTPGSKIGAAPLRSPTAEESEAAYRAAYGRYRPFQWRGSPISWVEYEDERHEPWTVTLGFSERDGALELAELHVFPTKADQSERGWNFMGRGRGPAEWTHDVSLVPRGGLTATALREMTGHLQEALRVALSAVPTPDSYLADAGFVAANRRAQRPPAARSPHTEEKLALGAVFYGRAVKLGLPIKDYVSEQLTRRGFRCQPESVRNLTTSMRDRGFLTGKTGEIMQGRAFGQATPKAWEIAKAEDVFVAPAA